MKHLVWASLLLMPAIGFSQAGISFHQSNLPFVGFNYEFKSKLRPEIRVGTDNYFDALSVEGVLTYDFARREEYDLYGGVGLRLNGFAGVVVPLGINVYPFTAKQFGFHVELAPIVGEESILRGSWGIRYRFKKKEK